jgi:hypothetical protein
MKTEFPILNRTPVYTQKLRYLDLEEVPLKTTSFQVLSKRARLSQSGLRRFPTTRIRTA